MDINAILNGLMNITTWIEDVIINGLLGNGFILLKEAFSAYVTVKPLIDMLNALFAAM